jgi:TonB family protein
VVLALASVPAFAQEEPFKPEIVTRVAPVYPPAAQRGNIEGVVVAYVRVDAEGAVRSVKIRRSPHELLSDAAEEALLKWRFRPRVKDGKPAPFVGEYQITFRLTDDPVIDPPSRPAPDGDAVSRYIASKEGVEIFRTEYWKANEHKAFAASEDGFWGWAGQYSTGDRAADAARTFCESNHRRALSPCRIVNIDGEWQEATARTGTPFRLLSPLEITSFSRETVESWPDDRKTRVLPFLDQCRVASDEFLKLWKKQDLDAIYASISQELRDQYARTEFDKSVGAMNAFLGTVAGTSYRNGYLMLRTTEVEKLGDPHAQLVYEATSPGWQGAAVFLVVRLKLEAGSCRVMAFEYLSMPQLAPWLENAPRPPEVGT